MRTTQEAKELIEKALEILRAHSDGRAIDITSRVDFQRGRSNRTDYLDWACWFIGWGDRLPPKHHAPWLCYIGRFPWQDHLEKKADDAIGYFAEIVPEELWVQGRRIEV